MMPHKPRGIHTFSEKVLSKGILKTVLIAGVLLITVVGQTNGQFGNFEEYFSEQMQQNFEGEEAQYIEDEVHFPDQQEGSDIIREINRYTSDISPQTDLTDPAYIYCLSQGGSVRTENGQESYCDLGDGTSCELMAFYEGKCGERREPDKDTSSEGCKGCIKGQVLDSVTGEPIYSAAIDAGSLCRMACPTTDQEGFYSLCELESYSCPNTVYQLTCSANGYRSATNQAITDGAGDATCNFNLDPISAETTYSFTVLVTDGEGQVVEGADVAVDQEVLGSTDSNGRLEVQLTDGEHDATAFKNEQGTGYWSGTLNHELNREFTINIPAISRPEPKEPSIRIVSIDPPEGTNLNAGESVDFIFTVEYDLGDNDYGKINAAVDKFTTGYTDDKKPVPDKSLDIGNGETRTGSFTFTLNDIIGLDWSNVYVSADLYAAKKGEPLPATISAYDYKEYPLKAEDAPSAEICFEGTAREFSPGNMPGSPTSWKVTVDKLISGAQPCTSPIDVVTYQSVSPPIWGFVDKSVEAGEKVEVYGAYVTDDEGCRVTLHGSESYYFKKATCNGIIRGHVYDAQTGEPIKEASLECSLYCDGPSITNDQGYYELSSPSCNICGLVYCSVTCSADGYEQEVQSLVTDVDGNGKKNLDFHLQPKKVSRVVIQGQVLDHAICDQNGNKISVLIKKVIEKPDDTMLISPDRVIEVHSEDCALINDLLKGHCYEFQGLWIDDTFWLQSDPLTTPVECSSDEESPGPLGCGKLLYYQVSKGKHSRGDIIRGDMKYKSNVNGEADFSGNLLLRSPSGQVYTGVIHQRTPRYEEDRFGYGKGNSIEVRLPSDAALGLYAAKLELKRYDTGELCDESGWMEDQFEVESSDEEKQPVFEEVKFEGKVLAHSAIVAGEDYYTIAVNRVLSGPKLNDEVDVCTASIFAKYPLWGKADTDILETNVVEVFGRIDRTHSKDRTDVTLNGRKEYYLKKISGVGCEGEISGHVFDIDTGLPISKAKVWSSPRRYNGGVSQEDGLYRLSKVCSNMKHTLYCDADGYERGSAEVTTDVEGNAVSDFHLKLLPECVQKDCQAQNGFEGQPTLKDGKFYMTYRDCRCKNGDCTCDTEEKEIKGVIMGLVLDANTDAPIEGATVCVDGEGVCQNCVRTNSVGKYIFSPGKGQGGCSFQPKTTYSLGAEADCYKSSGTTATTNSMGNAFQVNFKLQSRPRCKESDCDIYESPAGPEYTDKCGNVYQDYNSFKCQRCTCIDAGIEKRLVRSANNDGPWDPEILSSTQVSGKKLVPITIEFQSGDRENNFIKYHIDWDDGSGVEETKLYAPDAKVSASHTYSVGGTYGVTVEAEDECGGISGHRCTIWVTIIG